MPQSVVSHASRKSNVSKKSYVDDTLFGGAKSKGSGNGATVVSQGKMRELRQKTEKGQQIDGVVISKAELDRIRGCTVVKSKEQEIEEKKLYAEQKEQ